MAKTNSHVASRWKYLPALYCWWVITKWLFFRMYVSTLLKRTKKLRAMSSCSNRVLFYTDEQNDSTKNSKWKKHPKMLQETKYEWWWVRVSKIKTGWADSKFSGKFYRTNLSRCGNHGAAPLNLSLDRSWFLSNCRKTLAKGKFPSVCVKEHSSTCKN